MQPTSNEPCPAVQRKRRGKKDKKKKTDVECLHAINLAELASFAT